MIVRNEEHNLPACLLSAAGLTQDLIVVDTGSSDRTKEVAAAHGAKVVDFTWIDDFSAARNESVRHATGDWIFWLDADDRIDQLNHRQLCKLFQNLPTKRNLAFVMRYSCPLTPTGTMPSRQFVDQVRLFPNHPKVRWSYRVHEQIAPAFEQHGGKFHKTDITIDHLCYQDTSLVQAKQQRNLRLLRLDVQEKPDDPFTLFNLGWALQIQGQAAEAIPYIERALQLDRGTEGQTAKLYVILAQAQRDLGHVSQALETCRRGRDRFPCDPEILSTEAKLWHHLGNLPQSAACLEMILKVSPNAQRLDVGVEDGMTGFLTRHNLAIVYRDQGKCAEAEAQWREALQERPQWGPALVGLGELLLTQNRWHDLQEICRRLEKMPDGDTAAQLLYARGHLARREYCQARVMLEKLVADAPALLWPKVYLSRTLLHQGEDWEAAEACLRAILALDPNHCEAKHNLAKLVAKSKDKTLSH